MTKRPETHPFPPVLTPHATALMMGTFPPTPEKWCMPFHYPNFYNDMWRIYGLVFFQDAMYFQKIDEKAFVPEKIMDFMYQAGIASCPTVRQAIREKGNASDKFLTVTEMVNLADVLEKLPQLAWIFTTGGKATEILLSIFNQTQDKKNHIKMPKTNTYVDFPIFGRAIKLYRLPSSSRAYPMKLEKKVACYQRFFELAGFIT